MTSQTTNTKMRADQERVSHLLTDTVTLLCKNGLQFKTEMKVQGLLGITLDDEVFLVQIDKKFGDLVGADAVKVHVAAEQEEVTNNSISGSETSDVTSQSSRKRHRRKRRRSSASVESDVSANTKFPSKLEVKAEVVDADDDEDLVMLESDNKIGLHDKDTMRESYGVSYNADLGKLESNNYHDDTGQSLDDASVLAGGGGDQAGCSTWDDPLSVLTDQNSSMGPHSGREDMMDQQTMSTAGFPSYSPGRFFKFDLHMRRGRAPYKYVCDVKSCNKRFNYKQNLQRHQTIKHGRVPTKPQRWDTWDPLPPININMNQSQPPSQGGVMNQIFSNTLPSVQSPPGQDDMDQSSRDTQQNTPQDNPVSSASRDNLVVKVEPNDDESSSREFDSAGSETTLPLDGSHSNQSLDALEKVTNKVSQDASMPGDNWSQYTDSLSYHQQQPSTSAGGDGIYQCDRCEKSFNLKHNLRRHQTAKHGRPPRVLSKSPVRAPFWQ